VEFSLVVLGATIMEPQVIALQRNYTYNISNAVANEEQEQNLNNAISKDVAQFIVYRVIAAARTLPPSLMAAPATSPTPAAAVPAAATVSTPAAATQAPPV
jgi:outer membrane lipopolysaccharide assembly protein LptE/RlpB